MKSPVYNIKAIPIEEIVPQINNPNTMTGKSFAGLQQSIFNSGYTMPVVAITNPLYEKSNKTKLELINMALYGNGDEAKSSYGDYAFATCIYDFNIQKYFKYRVVDGQQRSSIIRLGTKYFLEETTEQNEEDLYKWDSGKLPDKPGKEMLKYLAWRENFTVPCTIIEETSEEMLISATVLHNPIYKYQKLYVLREIEEAK